MIERQLPAGNGADEALRKRRLEASGTLRRFSTLSAREKQVMESLSHGLISKQIARRLSLSAKTVEKHRSSVMRKMEVGSLAEVVRAAVQIGL